MSWIKGTKYVGIWWELHVNKSGWNYSDINNIKLGRSTGQKVKTKRQTRGNHERTKYYIDFCRKKWFLRCFG
ncbi:MAG: glycoside hydrolase family 97 catalytic domain-containing protein [Ignavibacteriales bacterium]|nr:glycoside hydrolase family 97 catalytic domain-containing protein [Ignavibacteriales bacterium]